MKKLIAKPHIFFFGLIPISILLAYFFNSEGINFRYYGASLTVELKYIYYVAAFFFGLIGINYFSIHWAKKTPKKGLTQIHIILQGFSFLLLITYNKWSWIQSAKNLNKDFVIDNSNLILFISFILFILASIIHVFNFFLSLFSKSK